MRHPTLLLCFFLLAGNNLESIPTKILTKTRRQSTSKTVDSLSLWYQAVMPKTALPKSQKFFNFSRREQIETLASHSGSFSHQELCATTDTELHEVALYFGERIQRFRSQTKTSSSSFSCIFKAKEPIQTTVAIIRLDRTKKQKLSAHIVLHGHVNEPSTEIVNLLVAACMDDTFLIKHVSKGFVALGALFAWLTYTNKQQQKTIQRQHAEIQTTPEPYQLDLSTHQAEVAITTAPVEKDTHTNDGATTASASTCTNEKKGIFPSASGDTAGAGEPRTPSRRDASTMAPEDHFSEITAETLHAAMMEMHIQKSITKFFRSHKPTLRSSSHKPLSFKQLGDTDIQQLKEQICELELEVQHLKKLLSDKTHPDKTREIETHLRQRIHEVEKLKEIAFIQYEIQARTKDIKILENRTILFTTQHHRAQVRIYNGKKSTENLIKECLGQGYSPDLYVAVVCREQKDKKRKIKTLHAIAKKIETRGKKILLCGLTRDSRTSTSTWKCELITIDGRNDFGPSYMASMSSPTSPSDFLYAVMKRITQEM